MPALTSVPDAQRPIGRFITEWVLPQWDSLNRYSYLHRHNRVVTRAMSRKAMQVRATGGLSAAIMLNGRVVGGREGRETTLVSAQAAEACATKSLTRAYWRASGVPTAAAEHFWPDDAAAAETYCRSASSPRVMKPDGARHGAGVSFGVSHDNFTTAWERAVSANRPAGSGDGVLIEDFHDALCLRFFVVGGQVRAVSLRVPLFVVGDGSSTVQQLLQESFAHQQRHSLLRITRPKITAQLTAASGLDLADVPHEGALHILQNDPRLPLGGLPYDVTAMISSELNDLASEAAVAIPGLGAAGIDVLAPRLDSAEEAIALDADSWAPLLIHGYPAFGRRRIIGTPIAHQLRLRADHWDRPVYSGSAQYAESPDEA